MAGHGTVLGRDVERRVAARVGDRDVRAPLDEEQRDLRVTSGCRGVQRGVLQAIRGERGHAGARVECHLRGLEMSEKAREMQRRPPIVRDAVDRRRIVQRPIEIIPASECSRGEHVDLCTSVEHGLDDTVVASIQRGHDCRLAAIGARARE